MEDEIELQEPTGLRNWMDDEQRILNIQQNPVREPMKSIRGVFIFVNQQHYIDKIVVEDIDVLRSEPPKGGLQLELRRSSETSNNERQSPVRDPKGVSTLVELFENQSPEGTTEFRIPFSKVLQLVQSKRCVTANTKYIFREVCLYNVDLEAEHVQGFVYNEEPRSFFRVLPATEDIVIPPSIFIFHSVNTLYFYFQEVPLKRVPEPKSILKTGASNSSSLFIEKRSFSDRSSRSEATSGVRLGPHNTTKKRVVLKKNQVFVDFSHTKGVEKITNNEGQRPVRVTRKHISVKNIDT